LAHPLQNLGTGIDKGLLYGAIRQSTQLSTRNRRQNLVDKRIVNLLSERRQRTAVHIAKCALLSHSRAHGKHTSGTGGYGRQIGFNRVLGQEERIA
jgi:hypothetical protein